MARQINQVGLDKIKGFEGLKLKAYPDSGGVWTVGYGHTSDAALKVDGNTTVSADQAEQLLRGDLAEAQRIVEEAVRVPLTDNQFAALVSFVFNVGAGNPYSKPVVQGFLTSTLLKKLNAGDYASVPAELKKWNRDGRKTVPGLTNRRAAEGGLWVLGAPVASASVNAEAPPAVTPIGSLATPENITQAVTVTTAVIGACASNSAIGYAVAFVIVLGSIGVSVFLFRRMKTHQG